MSSDGDRSDASRTAGGSRWAPPLLLAMLCVATGCRPAPQVPVANLVYSAAIRTATNTRSPDRLRAAGQRIDRDHAAGLIGPEEYAAYGTILRTAEAGQWTEAEQAAIRFRRDQLR